MKIKHLSNIVTQVYDELKPFSDKYRVDKKRYIFTLQILNRLGELNKKTILDVGTGIGLTPLSLQKLGAHAFGLDFYIFPKNQNNMFNNQSIEKIKKIWQRNNIHILDKSIYDNNLPWPNKYFDIVLSEAMIEHLKDPKKFIEQCGKFLKPRGYLLISTPNPATLLKRLRFLLGRSPNWPIESYYNAGENFTGHWREYTIKELIYMCQTSGFEIVKTYNKNLLASFKKISAWHKNFQALIVLISSIFPKTKEMNYILCRKK